MMSTNNTVHVVLENKAQVKAHAAIYGTTLTKFINAAVKEMVERDLVRSPPRVIVAGHIPEEKTVERRAAHRPRSDAKSSRGK